MNFQTALTQACRASQAGYAEDAIRWWRRAIRYGIPADADVGQLATFDVLACLRSCRPDVDWTRSDEVGIHTGSYAVGLVPLERQAAIRFRVAMTGLVGWSSMGHTGLVDTWAYLRDVPVDEAQIQIRTWLEGL